MNYKLEKFWNNASLEKMNGVHPKWTINLKSFEIAKEAGEKREKAEWTINLKSFEISIVNRFYFISCFCMNYKLEKFWNAKTVFIKAFSFSTWTINLKSFEMQ